MSSSYQARWIGESVSTDHLDQLCRDVATNLRRVIDEEIARLTSMPHLDREVMAHATFAAERRASFTGRARYLDAIAGTLAVIRRLRLSCTVTAGRASRRCSPRRPVGTVSGNSRAVVIERYVGATPASRKPAIRFCGISTRKSVAAYRVNNTAPGNLTELIREFQERLALAEPDRPLVFFLDSLDQVSTAYDAQGVNVVSQHTAASRQAGGFDSRGRPTG